MAEWIKIELGKHPFLIREENGVCFLHSTGKADYRPEEKKIWLRDLLGLSHLVCIQQVHGSRILAAKDVQKDSKGDGLILSNGDGATGVSVLTADCVPLLMIAPEHLILLHVGWKGLARGIVNKGAKILKDFYGGLENIKIWFGPHIKQCCYEVGNDVLEALGRIFPVAILDHAIKRIGTKTHLSLDACIMKTLENEGVTSNAFKDSGFCTCCSQIFPSYRREGDKAARLINLAWRRW